MHVVRYDDVFVWKLHILRHKPQVNKTGEACTHINTQSHEHIHITETFHLPVDEDDSPSVVVVPAI